MAVKVELLLPALGREARMLCELQWPETLRPCALASEELSASTPAGSWCRCARSATTARRTRSGFVAPWSGRVQRRGVRGGPAPC